MMEENLRNVAIDTVLYCGDGLDERAKINSLLHLQDKYEHEDNVVNLPQSDSLNVRGMPLSYTYVNSKDQKC